MADVIGRAYTRRELLSSEFASRAEVAGMRAYEVPLLLAQIVEAPTERDLPAALTSILRRHLPPFDWVVEPRINGAVRKYGLLHTSLAAPPDGSGEPMWLELAGDVVAVGGRDFDPSTTSWLDLRPMAINAMLDTEVPGPIRVKITVATYANARFPGVGVPFYL